MKKQTRLLIGLTVLLLCTIMLVIAFSIFAFLIIPGIDSSNFTDSNGLTSDQKKEAIWIALTGSDVKQVILENPGNCRVTEVSTLGSGGFTGKAGYLNTTGPYAQVPISVGGEGMFSEHYIAYVNLTGKDVTGSEWASYRHIPANAEISIPPYTGWYHEFKNDVNITLEYSGSNLMVTPLVLDNDNFRNAMEGIAYHTEKENIVTNPGTGEFYINLNAGEGKFLLILNDDTENTTNIKVRISPGF